MYVSADTVSHRSIEYVAKRLVKNVIDDINGNPDLLFIAFTASYKQRALYQKALKILQEESDAKNILGGTFPAVVTSRAYPTIKGGAALAIKSKDLEIVKPFYQNNVRLKTKKAAKAISQRYNKVKAKSKVVLTLSAGTSFPESAMESMKVLDTIFARKFRAIFNLVGKIVEKTQAKSGYGSTVYISGLLKKLYPLVKNLIGGATLDLDIKPSYQFISNKIFANGLVGTILSSDKIKFAQYWTFDKSKKDVLFNITQFLKSGYIQMINNNAAGKEFLDIIDISRELYDEAFSKYWYASLLYATALVVGDNEEYPFVSAAHPALRGLITSLPIALMKGSTQKARVFTQSGLGVVNSAKKCANECRHQLLKPLFGIFVNCANRLLISGDKIYEENKTISKELENAPFITFYSGGEYSIINKKPVMSSISIHGMVAGI